jgi:acetylornithine aminotransferase
VQALRVRSRVVFEYGRGCKLQDFDGREYLDMVAGIAVMALGTGRSSL